MWLECLDTIRWIQRHAARVPLGVADPDQPATGWCYSLSGDPGHPWAGHAYQRTSWIHDGVIHVWFRQDGHLHREWLLEAWHMVVNGPWRFRWLTRRRDGTWMPDAAWDPLQLMDPLSVVLTSAPTDNAPLD